MIKVYGIPASRAFRPLWMLEELGLEHETVPVDFAGGETRKPDFLALNPNGHIPVLDDDGVVLYESMAINLYLAQKYDRGRGLWPAGAADQGRTYQWSFWVMTEAEEPLLTAMMHRRILPAPDRDAARADDAEERARAPIAVLDGALDGRPYLLGDDFTAADLNVASVFAWARAGNIDLSGAPHAADWLGRCMGRPAARRARGG